MSKLVFSTLVVLSLLHQRSLCFDWVTDCPVWVVWVVEAECLVVEEYEGMEDGLAKVVDALW